MYIYLCYLWILNKIIIIKKTKKNQKNHIIIIIIITAAEAVETSITNTNSLS